MTALSAAAHRRFTPLSATHMFVFGEFFLFNNLSSVLFFPRSMYQGEEARLRSGGLVVARERKHLALCINNQVRGDQMSGLLECNVISFKLEPNRFSSSLC